MKEETKDLLTLYGSRTCVKNNCRAEYEIKDPKLDKLVQQILNLTETYYDDKIAFAVADLIKDFSKDSELEQKILDVVIKHTSNPTTRLASALRRHAELFSRPPPFQK